VVDHVDAYNELVSKLASMIIFLKNENAKTLKLENKNSFLKNSCEEHKHSFDVLKCLHGDLKLTHETLLISHEELLEQHVSLIKVFTKKLKNNESSSHGSHDQSHIVAILVI
jgi:hypothetical protein